VRELIAWCRTMAIVDRARCQQRLNQLAISSRYMPPPAAPDSAYWRAFDARGAGCPA